MIIGAIRAEVPGGTAGPLRFKWAPLVSQVVMRRPAPLRLSVSARSIEPNTG